MDSFEQLFSLKNLHVLITGGAGMLGAQHAEAVLKANGTPILVDIDSEALVQTQKKLVEKFDKPVLTACVDITSEEAIAQLGKDLSVNKKINVDILINNAARNPKVTKDHSLASSNRIEDLDIEVLMKDVEVGLYSALLCAKYFGSEMAKRGKGNILNISSDLGVIAPDQRLYQQDDRPDHQQDVKPVSYSIIKHGLVGLTKYLATYWADKGVRCNAISPGGVFAGQNEQFLQRVQNLIPMGRMADVDELQGTIIYLCSDASSYVNGANLIVDGGRTVW